MFSKLFGGKKDGAGAAGSSKPFTGDEGELWYIEGKAYDLAKFLKAHPGECGGRRRDVPMPVCVHDV